MTSWTGRTTVKYATTWRLLAELLRRHDGSRRFKLRWCFPGSSENGIVDLLQADDTRVLRLDVAHGLVLETAGTERLAHDSADRYAAALLESNDPKDVVDEIERACSLPSSPIPLPEATPQSLAATLIATALGQRMLERTAVRTSPAYIDNNGNVVASGWVKRLPHEWLQVHSEAARDWQQKISMLGHLFALHRGDGLAAADFSEKTSAVVFDLRLGIAHALYPGERTSTLSLPDAYTRAGRNLAPLLSWVVNGGWFPS